MIGLSSLNNFKQILILKPILQTCGMAFVRIRIDPYKLNAEFVDKREDFRNNEHGSRSDPLGVTPGLESIKIELAEDMPPSILYIKSEA